MNPTPIKKQTNPIAKLLWKLTLGDMYENPQFIIEQEEDEEDLYYLKVTDEFETLVWQNGDEDFESSEYVSELIFREISSNSFSDNLYLTQTYYSESREAYEKISELRGEIIRELEDETDNEPDYDVVDDKAKEQYFKSLINSTKSGELHDDIFDWLYRICVNYTTEFSDTIELTVEEVQGNIDDCLKFDRSWLLF